MCEDKSLINRMRLTHEERLELLDNELWPERIAEAALRKCLTVLTETPTKKELEEMAEEHGLDFTLGIGCYKVLLKKDMEAADLEPWPTCPVGGTSKP